MEDDFDIKLKRSTWGEFANEETPKLQTPKGKVLLECSSQSSKRSKSSAKAEPITEPSCTSSKDEEMYSDSSDETEEFSEGSSPSRRKLLSQVSRHKGELFFKSQQRGDPALSRREKKEIASTLLDANPSMFLSRYGKILESSHLTYFHRFRNNYEVEFYIQQLEKTAQNAQIVKNRRYEAMKQLIQQGSYFSMAEMRSRNPSMFHHLIEKYMTEEEKQSVDPNSVCNLSTVLMCHIDGDRDFSTRRKEQEAEDLVWGESDSEDEIQIDDDQKEILKEEFIASMQSSFLEGRDKEFDYSEIDDLNNTKYDDITLQERDAEDRYFDND